MCAQQCFKHRMYIPPGKPWLQNVQMRNCALVFRRLVYLDVNPLQPAHPRQEGAPSLVKKVNLSLCQWSCCSLACSLRGWRQFHQQVAQSLEDPSAKCFTCQPGYNQNWYNISLRSTFELRQVFKITLFSLRSNWPWCSSIISCWKRDIALGTAT